MNPNSNLIYLKNSNTYVGDTSFISPVGAVGILVKPSRPLQYTPFESHWDRGHCGKLFRSLQDMGENLLPVTISRLKLSQVVQCAVASGILFHGVNAKETHSPLASRGMCEVSVCLRTKRQSSVELETWASGDRLDISPSNLSSERRALIQKRPSLKPKPNCSLWLFSTQGYRWLWKTLHVA